MEQTEIASFEIRVFMQPNKKHIGKTTGSHADFPCMYFWRASRQDLELARTEQV